MHCVDQFHASIRFPTAQLTGPRKTGVFSPDGITSKVDWQQQQAAETPKIQVYRSQLGTLETKDQTLLCSALSSTNKSGANSGAETRMVWV